jgi:hypothetical protein
MGEVGYVYILKNEAMPGIYKIGITGRDKLEDRISELYRTNIPLPFECEFAAVVEDYEKVEDIIHNAFEDYRINKNRESFKVDPERVKPILKHLQIEDVTFSISEKLNESITEEDRRANSSFRRRRPSFKFEQMGIKVGSKITFISGDKLTEAIVVENNKVKYNGLEYSLNKLTKELLEINYQILPLRYWKYEGKSLDDYYNEAYLVGE